MYQVEYTLYRGFTSNTYFDTFETEEKLRKWLIKFHIDTNCGVYDGGLVFDISYATDSGAEDITDEFEEMESHPEVLRAITAYNQAQENKKQQSELSKLRELITKYPEEAKNIIVQNIGA